MKIELIKKDTPIKNQVEFDFVDTDKNEAIGKITYTIDKKKQKATIDYTYLHTEYQGRGVLKNKLDEILCDMKCQGAHVVKLHTITDSARVAWERLGFIEEYNEMEDGFLKVHMGKDLFTKKCDCLGIKTQ